MIIFRENTEDVYAGIEYAAGTPSQKAPGIFARRTGARVDTAAGVGHQAHDRGRLQAPGAQGPEHAVDAGRSSVTLVHKGNIMKFTRGAFRAWGYEVARTEFGDVTMTEDEAAAAETSPS
jgi:isocitrate dehydrogenase